MQFSGQQYELEYGDYAATITEVGARMRSLTYARRPLIASFDVDELPPLYRGAVLAPWPNRIADGRYSFAGESYELPLTEPARRTALHGLVLWNAWSVLTSSSPRGGRPNQLSLGCRIWPQQGYPFLLDLEMHYSLGADGLTIVLAAKNAGDRSAPYGCSIHPYLVAGAGRVDDWLLSLPGCEYLEVDTVRLLPLAQRSVVATRMDFQLGRKVGKDQVDHAFTGLGFDAARECAARLLHPDGGGVEMVWDDACRWVQLHTADRPEPSNNRVGLAIEPMTCPPNAFQTGLDLIRLEPGQTHRTRWRIAAL
jgi:aldose 1-epimerase